MSAGRGGVGSGAVYPRGRNAHAGGGLRTTLDPAEVDARTRRAADRIARAVMDGLDYVGVVGIELFDLGGGKLLVNEIAPRVHNSGHFTLGACAVSQFEQHLRAICGWPLAGGELLSPAVMVNLLGTLWNKGAPRWDKVLKNPRARLHLYGKKKAAPGRKMGHLLLLDDDLDRARASAEDLLARLRGQGRASSD